MEIMRKYDKSDYLNVPGREFRGANRDLTPTERIVFWHFYTLSNGMTYDLAKVARMLGLSERTVSTIRRNLQKKGYIYIIHTDFSDRYIIGKQAVTEFLQEFNPEQNA